MTQQTVNLKEQARTSAPEDQRTPVERVKVGEVFWARDVKRGVGSFYEVIAVTRKQLVLVEVKQRVVEIRKITHTVTPIKGVPLRTREYRKTPKVKDGQVVLAMPEGEALVWDGKPQESKY